MRHHLTAPLQRLNLQAKLTLFAALLALAAVGATSLFAWRLLDQLAERVARERLDQAAVVVREEYDNLLENAAITAQILAAWPLLEPAQTATGVEALSTILQAAPRTRSGDLIAFVGRDAVSQLTIERGGPAASGASLHEDHVVLAALAGREARGLEIVEGRVRAEAALPVRSGTVVAGAVLVASFLDETVADRLKSATAFDVTFYAGDLATATSLRLPGAPRQPRVVAPLDVRVPVIESGQVVERVERGAQGRTIVQYHPLHGPDGDVVGMYSISAPTEVLFEARTQVLGQFGLVVGAVLVLALVASAYVARAFSRPIRGLARAVQRIGEGDLTTPVTVASRDEVGSLGHAIDDMRLRLLKHAEEQEQLDRLKDQYLFNVAHELKTPLAALTASVQLLAEEGRTAGPAEQGQLITMVQRSTMRLRTLVENLLDLGSLRAGRFNISQRPASLADVIADAVVSVAPVLDGRQQRVETSLPDPPPLVLADTRRIQQVLVNLFANAGKYGPPGDVIQVQVEGTDGFYRIAITDHGAGIPLEEQPHLFEAYFRSARVGQATPGVGLGLAIVKAIVEAHGGQVGVASVPGQGTTIWFTVPAVEPVPAPTSPSSGAGAVGVAAVERQGVA